MSDEKKNLIEPLDDFSLELGITKTEATAIATELKLFKSNMQNSADIFKLKALGLIDNLKARNVSEDEIIAVLLDDFDNNGEIFGGFKRGLFRSSDEMLTNIDNAVKSAEWEKRGYDEQQVWLAVFINTCQDCEPRHGKKRPFSIWQSLGLPGSGWSVCKSNCQCQLVPSSIVDETTAELQEPIKRVRSEIREIARKKKKEGTIKNINKYTQRKLGQMNDVKSNLRKDVRRVLRGI